MAILHHCPKRILVIGTGPQEHETRVLNKEDVGGSPLWIQDPPGGPYKLDFLCGQCSFSAQSLSSQLYITSDSWRILLTHSLYTGALGKEQTDLGFQPSPPTF